MKDAKFRQDILNTQLKIAQLEALICAEGKIEKVQFKDRFGNTITRYRDMATGFLTSSPGAKSSDPGDTSGAQTDFSEPIKEAGPMGIDIPKMWDEIKKDPRAGIEKAVVAVMADSHVKAIKENAGWLSDNITGTLGLAMAKIERLDLKSEIANIVATVQQATGDAVAKVNHSLDRTQLTRAVNYGKGRIASIKEVVEEEKARKQKGASPMSAEQQANLASSKFHEKRAADNYAWNPVARNNARFVSEQVLAAKASMGKSPDVVDKILHDMGMATDKTKQVAESFKKRISEITPENYKEKLQEFAADCNVKPKGDPMTELFQFLHAGTAILTGVAGIAGPETAMVLAAAPIAPELMIELALSSFAYRLAEVQGMTEGIDRLHGEIAHSIASFFVVGGPLKKAGEKLASTAAQEGTQIAPEAKAAYSSVENAIAKAAKSEPAQKVSAAMQDALRKLGLSPKLAELPPEQASKVIQKAYSSKVAKAKKAIATAKSPAAPAPAQVEMGAHDLIQAFSHLMKTIGL
jgi:hypothetical protein